MFIRLLASWTIILGLGLSLAVSCSSGDDDDDSGSPDADDDAGDDDSACTQETVCEYAVQCGYWGSLEECMAEANSGDCADLAGQTECSCACAEQYDACGSDAFDCGVGCVQTFC